MVERVFGRQLDGVAELLHGAAGVVDALEAEAQGRVNRRQVGELLQDLLKGDHGLLGRVVVHVVEAALELLGDDLGDFAEGQVEAGDDLARDIEVGGARLQVEDGAQGVEGALTVAGPRLGLSQRDVVARRGGIEIAGAGQGLHGRFEALGVEMDEADAEVVLGYVRREGGGLRQVFKRARLLRR